MSISGTPEATGVDGRTPLGTLGYAPATANQNFTTLVDITSLTTTVTVGTGRRVRISTRSYLATSVASDSVAWRIMEGATQLQIGDIFLPAASRGDTRMTEVVLTPSAGSHTYKITGERTTGTGTITSNASATAPAFILVEDIGAA